MTKEELYKELENIGFKREHYSEYNKEFFSNKEYIADNVSGHNKFAANIEIFVEYYNITIRWWYGENQKVTKSYPSQTTLPELTDVRMLLKSFFEKNIELYKITPLYLK